MKSRSLHQVEYMGEQAKGCIFFVPDSEGEIGGRPIVNNRNLQALQRVFSEVKVITYKPPRLVTKSRLKRLIMNIGLIFTPNYSGAYFELLDKAKAHPGYHVFFSHSKFGVFIRGLKRTLPNVMVSAFFHNVELSMSLQRLRVSKNLRELAVCLKYQQNERLVCKYADSIFVLNRRDGDLLQKYYSCSKEKIGILPMSLIDGNYPPPSAERK